MFTFKRKVNPLHEDKINYVRNNEIRNGWLQPFLITVFFFFSVSGEQTAHERESTSYDFKRKTS